MSAAAAAAAVAAKRKHSSHPDYVPDPTKTYEYQNGQGRRDSRVAVKAKKSVVTSALLDGSPAAAAVDRASIPLTQTGMLDVCRVSAALLRDDRRMVSVSATRPNMCKFYDLAANEAGVQTCDGDYDALDMSLLVGKLFPVFSQVRRTIKSSNVMLAPIPAGDDDAGDHPFALRPALLCTLGDKRDDQGEILAQGVIVSNKCLNHPLDSESRLDVRTSPAFEDSVAYLWITHDYSKLSIRSLGPPRFKTQKTDDEEDIIVVVPSSDRNLYESRFKWQACVEKQGIITGKRGFTELKDTGMDFVRSVLSPSWTIRAAMEQLAIMRTADPQGEHPYLLDLVMTIDDTAEISGLVLRKFLLVEMLLLGTPLAPLAHPVSTQPVSLPDLPPAPAVPGGARGLYDRMKLFLM